MPALGMHANQDVLASLVCTPLCACACATVKHPPMYCIQCYGQNNDFSVPYMSMQGSIWNYLCTHTQGQTAATAH